MAEQPPTGVGLFWLWQQAQHQATERARVLRETQEALEQARREVQASETLKTTFLANMSHELRTPLNAIINFAEFTMSGDFGPLTEQQTTFQQRVLANGRHLLGLINDILDLATIEAGQSGLEVEVLDLQPLLEGIRSTGIGLTKEKGLDLLLDLPEEGLPPVWADPQRVRRVLLELMSNAAKFTRQGCITLRARAQSDGYVALSVIDTGIGITPERQAQIFDSFYQAQNDLDREYGGTGLGLPICRRLIEMHGGSLTLESSSAGGSTFTFTLPGTLPAPTLAGRAATSLLPEPSTRRIVVVDDDPDAQTILAHTLTSAGWQVHGVMDGRLAQETIRRVRPDLILLDLQMPTIDGWTLLERFRADPELASIPVVICSIIDATQAHVGVIQQVQGWLVKPVLRQRLLTEVARYARPTARVLVVDDDPDSRLILRSILTEYGWEVQEAVNGEQALAHLAKERPDLMILDLMMPGIDGFEVLRHFDQEPPGSAPPVVVLTAQDLTPEQRRWLEQRTQGYFQKTSFPLVDFALFLHSLVERDTGDTYDA